MTNWEHQSGKAAKPAPEVVEADSAVPPRAERQLIEQRAALSPLGEVAAGLMLLINLFCILWFFFSTGPTIIHQMVPVLVAIAANTALGACMIVGRRSTFTMQK